MKLEFIALGGAPDPKKEKPPIGGSAYALIYGDSALLVDCGAYPQLIEPEESKEDIVLEPEYEKVGQYKLPKLKDLSFLRRYLERDDPFLRAELGAKSLPNYEALIGIKNLFVIATHGHFDHIGSLPLLTAMLPQAKAFMTEPTFAISSWAWKDSIRIARDRRVKPLFVSSDIDKLSEATAFVRPWEKVSLGPFEIIFIPSGHILGAVGVLARVPGNRQTSVLLSGDLTIQDQHTVPGARFDTRVLGEINNLVIESTYAGRIAGSPKFTEELLVCDVTRCLSSGGKALIAVPSIGKAQEVFEILRKAGVRGIRIDGSAKAISKIYAEHQVIPPDVGKHFVFDDEERASIIEGEKPVLVIAPSGMLSGGQAVRYAASFAGDPANLIGLSSYQDPCSPGHKLLSARSGQIFRFGKEQEGIRVELKARIKNYPLSGHLNGSEILDVMSRLSPSRTFLVHGDESGMEIVCNSVQGAEKAFLNERYSL